jgi:hypothetical protein
MAEIPGEVDRRFSASRGYMCLVKKEMGGMRRARRRFLPEKTLANQIRIVELRPVTSSHVKVSSSNDAWCQMSSWSVSNFVLPGWELLKIQAPIPLDHF